jgi:hypothetical protein
LRESNLLGVAIMDGVAQVKKYKKKKKQVQGDDGVKAAFV